MKTRSTTVVAIHVLATKRNAAVPWRVVDWQVGKAEALRRWRFGDGNGRLVFARWYLGRRHAADAMVRADLDAGAYLIHDEALKAGSTCSVSAATVRAWRHVRKGFGIERRGSAAIRGVAGARGAFRPPT